MKHKFAISRQLYLTLKITNSRSFRKGMIDLEYLWHVHPVYVHVHIYTHWIARGMRAIIHATAERENARARNRRSRFLASVPVDEPAKRIPPRNGNYVKFQRSLCAIRRNPLSRPFPSDLHHFIRECSNLCCGILSGVILLFSSKKMYI